MQVNKRLDVNIAKAKYTLLLHNFLDDVDEYNELRLEINELFNTFGTTGTLWQEFVSMFRWYEICDKDVRVFTTCVMDTFREYVNYYQELFTNYTKEYDYATGNKKTVTRNDESHSEGVNDVVNTTGSTSKDYDLPNKVVDSNSENGYLTGKNVREGNSNVNSENENASTYDSVITTEYHDEFLTLKNRYMNQIRNLYHEFCEKFNDCFLHIY